MNVLALLDATTLLGGELRETLSRRHDLWRDVRLLTTAPEDVGLVTEFGGTAALVQAWEPGGLAGVDLLFSCGPHAPAAPLVAELAGRGTAIAVAPDMVSATGVPVVAGVNLEAARAGGLLVSPRPAVILLAHLLHPLAGHQPRGVVAQAIEPASGRGQEGVDELLEQTRAILSFKTDKPQQVFGSQLAFNLLPAVAPTAALAGQLQRVLRSDAPIGLQTVQGAVFHGLAATLFVRLDDDPGVEGVRESLGRHPHLELVEEGASLGPIDAASRDKVLVGDVQPAPGLPGGYWLWGVLDNLTRGGATNAVEIAEAVLSGQG